MWLRLSCIVVTIIIDVAFFLPCKVFFSIFIQALNSIVITNYFGHVKVQPIHTQKHIIWSQRKYIQMR